MSANLLLSALALDFAENQPPEILYHYTTADALLSIVRSGSIWATNIDYLNDSSEVDWMWNAVATQLELAKQSEDKEKSAYAAEVLKKVKERRRRSEFVTSFSEKDDDLSQWRAYCPGGFGYSIGFDSAALRTQWISDPSGGDARFVGGALKKIRYLGKEQATNLGREVEDVMKFSPSVEQSLHGPVSKEDVVIAILGNAAPSVKHFAFSNEEEWRLIFTKPHKPMPHQRFRSGKSTIVPYVEAILNRDLNSNAPANYMIKRIVIGPTPNRDLSERSLRALFTSVGQPEVQIDPSDIPYRHW